jgi:NTP pyrophosphatase (non-canonical NTP hydrolase)
LDREKLRNELGDVLWYVATMASDLGIPLSDVASANVDKLRKRYPEGFSVERSVNRDEGGAP